jgi:hypothetical protein
MQDENIKIKVKTEGFEEATQEIDMLAEAYDGFPSQVTIKYCHDCTINIYPSQTIEKCEVEDARRDE